jgi:17beta-estradiol 17-dehydrogenase / very-long-chain 3-oxoacyl-CoA reductase
MINRKPPSLILNIGSLDGRIPAPLLAAYSCTKGGLQPWSIALAEEVKKDNIDVQMVLPAFVVCLLFIPYSLPPFLPSSLPSFLPEADRI